jgi:hypothetical protein
MNNIFFNIKPVQFRDPKPHGDMWAIKATAMPNNAAAMRKATFNGKVDFNITQASIPTFTKAVNSQHSLLSSFGMRPGKYNPPREYVIGSEFSDAELLLQNYREENGTTTKLGLLKAQEISGEKMEVLAENSRAHDHEFEKGMEGVRTMFQENIAPSLEDQTYAKDLLEHQIKWLKETRSKYAKDDKKAEEQYQKDIALVRKEFDAKNAASSRVISRQKEILKMGENIVNDRRKAKLYVVPNVKVHPITTLMAPQSSGSSSASAASAPTSPQLKPPSKTPRPLITPKPRVAPKQAAHKQAPSHKKSAESQKETEDDLPELLPYETPSHSRDSSAIPEVSVEDSIRNIIKDYKSGTETISADDLDEIHFMLAKASTKLTTKATTIRGMKDFLKDKFRGEGTGGEGKEK